MLSFSSASEQSSPPPCHPTTTFAGDISAPKLTFRFGAAATATAAAAAAATASSPPPWQPPPPPLPLPSLRLPLPPPAPRARLVQAREASLPRSDAGHHPTTQAFLDGGTGALKSTLRFPFAAEGATAPLSRGGGTAARSRATCRRANHLLAAASTAAAAPARLAASPA